ncbi:CBS domain-containing protein [Candidatus Magnetomoraceae bacterium gMMP-15]
MKTIYVKELMVPLSDYATVSEDANLYEAVVALEKAQQDFNETKYRHRAVLILDKKNNVIGKLSQIDILKALEPKYKQMGEAGRLASFGFSQKFLNSMVDQYKLWSIPLKEICRQAAELKCKDIMYTPTEGEYVEENSSLEKAVHQLVIGHHQSLLVANSAENIANCTIVGILKLTDVFRELSRMIQECKL